MRNMSDVPERLKVLRGETDQARYEFLQSDLAICFTFAEVAMTELTVGDRDGAVDALERAEKGYATIQRIQSDLEREQHRNEIAEKLNELRNKLDSMDELLRTSSFDADAES
jgi:hypothetical protein